MSKTALAVAVAGTLTLGWNLYSAKVALNQQRQTLAEQQQRILTLTAALADKSRQETLASQVRCATQAEKVFRELGFGARFSQSTDTNSLESHFNSRLRACFMTVETNRYRSGRRFVSRFLFNADDEREYAEYVWMSDAAKRELEPLPLVCKEFPLSGPARLCRSDGEYKAIVNHYME